MENVKFKIDLNVLGKIYHQSREKWLYNNTTFLSKIHLLSDIKSLNIILNIFSNMETNNNGKYQSKYSKKNSFTYKEPIYFSIRQKVKYRALFYN